MTGAASRGAGSAGSPAAASEDTAPSEGAAHHTIRSTIAIVGAGIAGIGLAIRLKRAGIDDFVLLEAADQVGGVWRDNVYPGVACDIPSPLYSYSFLPQPEWSRLFAPGAEIHRYLLEAVASEGLRPHLRLSTPMRSARWDDSRRVWSLRTGHTRQGPPSRLARGSSGLGRAGQPDALGLAGGADEVDGVDEVAADVLVIAAGRQSAPLIPDIDGLDRFTGRAFHSSRWDPNPLGGLRVGIVGTGASAVQLLPHVADQAASTVVFQRTPAWVLPRGDRDSAETPLPERSRLAAEAEELYEARRLGSPSAARLTGLALEHLRRQVADPELRRALTPSYEIGCKRAVFSDDYYPSLQRTDVTLEASALSRVAGGKVQAASGRSHELDVLILATGFDTAHQPYAPLVTGRSGVTLADHWASGMRSYASTAVHGFPNMFIMGGPNAALGHHSAIEVLEAQMGYILGAVDHLGGHRVALEIPAEAEIAHAELIDRLAIGTVWTEGGCTSWYLDRDGRRPGVLWPARVAEFRRRYGVFDPDPYREVA